MSDTDTSTDIDVIDDDVDDTEGWPPWAPGFIESMRQIPSLARSAKVVGINRRTVFRWMKREESFARAVAEAREEALDSLEEIALLRGRTGQPTKKTVTRSYKMRDGKGDLVDVTETTVTDEAHISDNLLMFYLKRWRPAYRDTFDVKHSGDARVRVEVYRMPDQERLHALARLARELEPLPEDVPAVIEGRSSTNGST